MLIKSLRTENILEYKPDQEVTFTLDSFFPNKGSLMVVPIFFAPEVLDLVTVSSVDTSFPAVFFAGAGLAEAPDERFTGGIT